jgi:hypothetical protein
MRRLAAAALLLAMTAGQLSSAPHLRARRDLPPRCLALRVETADAEGRRGRRGRTFSAAEVADLRFEVWIKERFASEPITVKLFTPRDKLYQVLNVGADGAISSDRLRARIASRLHLSTLGALFPVAGTQVTTYALYGEWRAEAYIGEAESPCTRPLDFVIEP